MATHTETSWNGMYGDFQNYGQHFGVPGLLVTCPDPEEDYQLGIKIGRPLMLSTTSRASQNAGLPVSTLTHLISARHIVSMRYYKHGCANTNLIEVIHQPAEAYAEDCSTNTQYGRQQPGHSGHVKHEFQRDESRAARKVVRYG